MMKTLLSFLKRFKYIVGAVVVVAVIAVWQMSGSKTVTLRTSQVKRGDIRQEVSITGRIKAADTVDLAFEKSGRIVSIPVHEGDKVSNGTVLIQLESQELFAQRQREVANVQTAQTKLNQLVSGARPEDIKIAQTTVDSAARLLDITVSRDSIDTARTAINSSINAMVVVSDVQSKYTYTKFGEEYNLTSKKELAMQAIYNRTGLGIAQSWLFLPLQDGLKAELAALGQTPKTEDVKALLSKIKNALTLSKDTLDAAYGVTVGAGATDTDKATVTAARTDVLTKIDTITAQEQAVITAENNLQSAQASLELKKAPATQFDIDIAKSNLTQAQANLSLIDAQLSKQTLRSPITGTVAKIIGRRGEIATPSTPVVSVISDAKFQIEANVPEADIAKVKIGNTAEVTLDAYGQDVIFQTRIISIDPGETIVEGVATYKVTFEFTQNDSRILSGLTANVDVLSDSRSNVLYVPTRDIVSRDGKKYITLLVDSKTSETHEVEITIGLKGSDGRTEVTSGLSEGNTVVE